MPILEHAKHEHFAKLVSNGETPQRAYVLAGYKEKGAAQSASRLLKDARVCERIAELRAFKEQKHEAAVAKAIEKTGATKEWVLAQLMENVEMAKQAIPVLDREGNETGEYEQNLPAANRALELIGKELGMFIEKREVGKPGDFSDLTDDELQRQLAEAERAYAESERAIRAARGPAAKAITPSGG